MRLAVFQNSEVAWRCGRAFSLHAHMRRGPCGSGLQRPSNPTSLLGVAQVPTRTLHSTGAAAADVQGMQTVVSDTGGSARPRVCILGGGFGGLYTAIKLELLMWPKGRKPQITLIDQGERFIFKPLLYELLNGTAQSWEVAPTFAQLLAPYPIQFIQDTVLSVEPDQALRDGGSATGGVVQLASGSSLPYDWLVVALGASADPRGVPGIRENARPFVSLDDAEYVAGRLAAFEAQAATGQQEQATVVIVGAGYAGVELAAVVGERMRGKASVVLVTPGPMILEAAPPGQRQAAEETLRSLGVTIMTNTKASAVERATTVAAATAAATASTAASTTSPVDEAGDIPIRPASPEAAAVQPLAVLAAAAAATAEQSSADANAGPSSIDSSYGNGTGRSAGPAPTGAASTTSTTGSSSTGESPSYVVRLEPASPAMDGSSGELAADLVLWTAGSKPASTPLQPFSLNSRGQLETDPTLQVLKHARVFALGDVSKGLADGSGDGGSTSSGGFYPATAQVAFQQADYAAWNIWAGINGRPLLPFRYQHLGDMMSLGAANAAVALPFQLPNELTASISSSPLGSLLSVAGLKLGGGQEGVTLEGPLAQLLRRAAYLYRQPTNEQRLNVAASWIEQAVTTAARLAAELSAANGNKKDSSTLRS